MGALCFFLKCLPLAGRDAVGQWLVYLSLALVKVLIFLAGFINTQTNSQEAVF